MAIAFKKARFFALILITVGLSLCLIFYPFFYINSTPLLINIDSNKSLIGRVYTPKQTTNSQLLPVAILGHGISSSKEMMIPLAIELARNKIAAIVFDFGGFGESYPLPSEEKSVDSLTQSTVKDAQVILNYIQDHQQLFNQEKIAIVGHSMGGVTAIDLASQDKRLKATVSLGIGGKADINNPANLLFAIGTYEQLNPPFVLRPLLASATENPDNCLAQIHKNICGDFSQGNARKLFISPTSDHFTSLYNSILIREIISWLKQSWQLSIPILSPKISYFIIGIILLFIGLILFFIDILLSYPSIIKTRLLPIAIAFIFLVGRLNQNWFPVASNLIIFCFCLNLVSNYAYNYPDKWLSKIKTACLYVLLLCFSFLIPSGLQNWQEFINNPRNILYIPLFTFNWLFFFIYNFYAKLKVLIFPQYTFALSLSLLVILLLIIDNLKIGIVTRSIEKLGIIIVRWLRQPFRLGIKNISPKELQILTILGIILSVVIWQRFQDGLLKDAIEAGWVVVRLFIFFVVSPIIITVLGIRWGKIEKVLTP